VFFSLNNNEIVEQQRNKKKSILELPKKKYPVYIDIIEEIRSFPPNLLEYRLLEKKAISKVNSVDSSGSLTPSSEDDKMPRVGRDGTSHINYQNHFIAKSSK
jgi:hypothetical protein